MLDLISNSGGKNVSIDRSAIEKMTLSITEDLRVQRTDRCDVWTLSSNWFPFNETPECQKVNIKIGNRGVPGGCGTATWGDGNEHFWERCSDQAGRVLESAGRCFMSVSEVCRNLQRTI